MKGRFSLLAVVAVLLILIVGPLAQAQPHPLKVGLVVRVEASDALDPGAIAGRIMHQVERVLGDARAFALVDQELLHQAQERLDIHLGTTSSVRELHAVADVLHLDRLVIIHVKASGHFELELTAVVFNPRGDEVNLTAFNARGPNLNDVLERAVGGLLERVFPHMN